MLAVEKGKMRCAFKGTKGRTVHQTLFPVKVVQGFKEDMFSVTAELSNGGVLSSDRRKNIVLKYEDDENIVFNWCCKTQDGWIEGIKVLPCTSDVAKLSRDSVAKHSKWKDVNELHRELGHPGEDTTRAKGKHMNLKVTCNFSPCEDCAVWKAEQTKMNKGVNNKSEILVKDIY